MPTNRSHVASFCQDTLDELYRYARRLCGGDPDRTADLVQETYAALIRHLDAFPDDEIGIGWLITCCRHRHLDTIRRRRRRSNNEQRAWRAEPRRAADGTDDPRIDHRDVVDALGRVTDPGRTALVLRHVDGMPVAEVAASLGRSVPATDSLLRRARARLYQEYRASMREVPR